MKKSVLQLQTTLFSNLEIAQSVDVVKGIMPQFDVEKYFQYHYEENKVFDCSYNTTGMEHPNFISCKLNGILFDGTIARNSNIVHSTLTDCAISDASFNYSDFTGTVLNSAKKRTSISSTNLNSCVFSESIFDDILVKGSSFNNSVFYNSRLLNSELQHVSFVDSVFVNSEFDNVDFSTTSLDYADIKSCKAQNVILKYFSPLKCYGGLQFLEAHKKDIRLRLPNSKATISSTEFFNTLDPLEPLLFSKKDFFSLANIYIYFGQNKKAYETLKLGSIYALANKSFQLLSALIRLASNNLLFTKQELKSLYALIEDKVIISEFNHHEFQEYIREMSAIKELLVENPYEASKMIVEVKTSIKDDSNRLLSEVLVEIQSVMQIIGINTTNKIIITHNSPFSIIIEFVNNTDKLFESFGSFTYLILGSTAFATFMAFFQNARNKALDNKKKCEEIENLKLQNQKLKSELASSEKASTSEAKNYKASSVTNVITSVQYTIVGEHAVQSNLRKCEIKNENLL